MMPGMSDSPAWELPQISGTDEKERCTCVTGILYLGEFGFLVNIQ